jgi:uncharacterized membrane protein YeaQ/YmgE (transglycosylase-associated protein family)
MIGKNILSLAILVAVGALCGILFVKVFNKRVLGNIWGGIIVGVIGGVLIGYLLDQLKFLVDNELNVNFLTSFIGAFVLLWVYSKISHQE